MISKQWFENDELRYASCLEAVLGFYGITRAQLCSPLFASSQKVFIQLLNVFRVSEQTIERQTGWDKLAVRRVNTMPRAQGYLTEREQRTACVLIRHVLISTDKELDEDLPPNQDSLNRYRNPFYEVRRQYENAQQVFLDSPRGQKWWKKFFKRVDDYNHVVNILRRKPDTEESGDRGRWSENPINDPLIWDCLRNFVIPGNWNGGFVMVARGYKFALNLNKVEKTAFDNDGRIVLLRGKSAYSSAPPADHCLIFLTAFAARAFVRESDSEYNTPYEMPMHPGA